MITRVVISMPGDTEEGGYWVHVLGDKFRGYEITRIISANNLVSLHGSIDGVGEQKLLRSYNSDFVICTDYV